MKVARLTCILAVAFSAASAQTQTLTVLHNFTGPDGNRPHGALLFDQTGNLNGTTIQGGTAGLGTVFKLDPSGNESVLYSFDGAHGAYPVAGVVRDTAGNLYGTTSDSFPCGSLIGCGTVFKLDPTGTETELHRFGGASDGADPTGPLALDSAGNLYGTTLAGGGTRCKRYIGAKLVEVGCGTVFRVDANGQESILHSFGVTDGAFPSAGLLRDPAGNLFGTAYQGGLQNCTLSLYGCGTVFKVDTTMAFSVLYSLQGSEAGPDGAHPQASLTLDPAGNLYSTTPVGGSAKGCPSLPQQNCGTIFQLTLAGKEIVVYSFKGGLVTAGSPTSGLVRDAAGNFYGLAGGTAFKLDATGKESDLFTFTGADVGVSADLVQDANGNLYGVTPHGTTGFGTVFKLTTPADFAVPAFTLTPAAVSPGSPASATLQLTAVSGFTDSVTLACSVSPKPALAPQCSVTPSAAPGTQVSVMVITTGPSARLSSLSGSPLSFAVCLPLLGLLGIGNRFGSRQTKIKALLLGCVFFAGIVLQMACGGSSIHSSGTPAGSYTITVTGTSSATTGSLVRSTNTTLQVQ
jgi:uncharacterized repeat protein (TIGR03803 family)